MKFAAQVKQELDAMLDIGEISKAKHRKAIAALQAADETEYNFLTTAAAADSFC